ncbi:MT-A70 family methyltransferase, partial [Mesorhizobium sp.]|uniref:MT-A70 family methyltransferase n=1 Tax=Mesorhizobium sp. TaxID=1871066 RepID=UPI0025C01590
IATRGNPVAPAMGDQLDSWCEDMAVEADVGRHSAKPAVFAEWIEKHWPNTPKIELNARAPRPGWDVWGNESNPEAKASEDNGGTSATDGAPMAGEASRTDAGRSASATSERTDATAGETAPNSKRCFGDALVDWAELRRLEARDDLTPEEIARRDFLKPIVAADLAPIDEEDQNLLAAARAFRAKAVPA